MPDRRVEILVVGAGAIGGVTAAFMQMKGYSVSLLVRSREQAEELKKEGLHISGIRGEIRVKVPVYASLEDYDREAEVIFHATKAYDLVESLQKLREHIPETALIVSMQNGMCEDEFSKYFTSDRVLGCVVGWGSTYLSAGRYEMTSRGEFVIGAMGRLSNDRLILVRDMLNSVLPTEISGNIRGFLYSKLIINSAITSLGMISGLRLGQMLRRYKFRRLFISIMEEAVAVADAMGIRIEPYAGKLDYYSFTGDPGLLQGWKRHLIMAVIGAKYRRLHSSALQSLERGRPTEIPWLNGYIVENAKQHKLQVPVNAAILKYTKAIEQKRLPVGMETIKNMKKEIQ